MQCGMCMITINDWIQLVRGLPWLKSRRDRSAHCAFALVSRRKDEHRCLPLGLVNLGFLAAILEDRCKAVIGRGAAFAAHAHDGSAALCGRLLLRLSDMLLLTGGRPIGADGAMDGGTWAV